MKHPRPRTHLRRASACSCLFLFARRHCPHVDRSLAYHFGAHREGVSINIAPSTNSRNTRLQSLRDELIVAFRNPNNSSNQLLLFAVPDAQATHNNLPTPTSPEFSLTDLPTLSSTPGSISPLSAYFAGLSLNPTPPNIPQQPINTMTTRMPARGDRSAPTFDHTKPRELKRFFVDIEYLFKAIPTMSETEKKEHATR